MKIYPDSVEENLRDELLVRDWVKSGLLDAHQGSTTQADLQIPLRRTNDALRAVLAFFTMVIVVAAAALTASVFHPGRDAEWLLAGLWAVLCGGSAWALASQARLYRCGAEEMLAVLAVCFLAGSVGALPGMNYSVLASLLAGALGSLGVYQVFGYRYAIVAATTLAGLTPAALKLDSDSERLLCLIVFGLVFFLLQQVRTFFEGDVRRDDLTAARGAACAGFYLACNLMITRLDFVALPSQPAGWFYWSTYVVVWIVPALALWRGIHERERMLLDLGGISLLATIVTNKAYLRWPRHTWDPILLGVFLIVVAIAIRRWLARGPNSERSGFTPVRLLDSENRVLAAAGALSLTLPHTPAPGTPQPDALKPGGGQSGGGGASGSF